LVCAGVAVVGVASGASFALGDGDLFHATLPDGLRACLARSGQPLDPADCKALTRLPELPAETTDARTFAIGFAWPSDSLVVVRAMLAKGSNVTPLNREQSVAFAGGAANAAAKQYSGARVRGTPDVKVVEAGGLPVARIDYDIDGLPRERAFMQHAAAVVVAADDGDYSVCFNASAAHAAEADALADELLPTLAVLHPAKPARLHFTILGRIVGFTLLVFLATVLAILVGVRASRRKRVAPASMDPPRLGGFQ
jgi:hypothetical protein